MPTRLSAECLVEYIKQAIPQYGGGDGRLRLIVFPASHLSGMTYTREIWYDGNLPTSRVSTWEMGGRSERGERKPTTISKEDFDAVWDGATALRAPLGGV